MSVELRTHCMLAAEGIGKNCERCLHKADLFWDYNFRNDFVPDPEDLLGCEEPMLVLLGKQARTVFALYQSGLSGLSAHSTEKKKDNLARRLKPFDQLLDHAYRKFYASVYDALPPVWRLLYTEASILKFGFIFHAWCEDICAAEHLWGPGHEDAVSTQVRQEFEQRLNGMIHTLDRAMILAGGYGATRGRAWIENALQLLEKVWQTSTCGPPGRAMATTEPFGAAPANGTSLQNIHGRGTESIWSETSSLSSHDGITPFSSETEAESMWSETPSFSSQDVFTPTVSRPLPRAKECSMEEFQWLEDHTGKHESAPIIYTGLVETWPALTTRPWCKPAYLLSHTFGGRRLVPVELGRSYVDEDWGQKLIPFGDFVREYIEQKDAKGEKDETGGKAAAKPRVGYLAQHTLFTQLPRLYKDITTPDLCFTTPSYHPCIPALNKPKLVVPLVNAWFGPGGTITPLHTDPYHNLLVQVVGRKYVRLYAPRYSDKLEPMGMDSGVDMSNTSSVDVGVMEGWDSGEIDEVWKAELQKVPYFDCILEPGETLYIPVGWWHYVRSLSVSFSVSFWWN